MSIEVNGSAEPATPVAEGAEAKGGTEQSQTALKESTGASAPSTEAKEAIRKLKLKVNGADRELSESDVIALAQKGMASDEKFRKASEESKRVASLLKRLNEDPDGVLKALTGRDPEEIYKERLAEKIRRLSMDPREAELDEARTRLKEYEAKEKERQAETERAKQKAGEEYWAKKYNDELSAAIREAGLPANAETIRIAAEIELANVEEGLEIPMSAVMELARERYRESFTGSLKSSTPDEIYEFLGEELFRKLQGVDSKKRKSPIPDKVPTERQSVSDESRQDAEPKPMSMDEWREATRKRLDNLK